MLCCLWEQRDNRDSFFSLSSMSHEFIPVGHRAASFLERALYKGFQSMGVAELNTTQVTEHTNIKKRKKETFTT